MKRSWILLNQKRNSSPSKSIFMSTNTFFKELIKNIEENIYDRCDKLLTLSDRDELSESFGSFDRAYWQYKIKDFSSGMSQEAIYPLAMAVKGKIINPETSKSKMQINKLIQYGALYSLKKQNSNGSVDDYFPYEQASGATAFTSFAIISCLEINSFKFTKQEHNKFKKRLSWLANHKETGKLSNHEALISLVLAKSSRFYKDKFLLEKSYERCKRLLGWKSNEGWFDEYGGFDLGYETLTFSCLIEIIQLLPKFKKDLKKIIKKNAEIIMDCVEPDFCLGGELYARGTWNFFAHGLLNYALDNDLNMIPTLIKVLESRFIKLPVSIQDDYILQHHLWSDLKTLDILKKINNKNLFNNSNYDKTIKNNSKVNFRIDKFYKDSGHLFISHGNFKTHISIKMGGLFRTYYKNDFIIQDTQNTLKIRKEYFVANSLNKDIDWEWLKSNKLVIKGKLCKYKKAKMTTFKLVILRIVMFCIGKHFPNLIRKLMQKVLITSKLEESRTFERELIFEPNKLKVNDRYFLKNKDLSNVSIQNSSFNNFKHVVMSRIFHPYYLKITSPKNAKISKFKNYINYSREW